MSPSEKSQLRAFIIFVVTLTVLFLAGSYAYFGPSPNSPVDSSVVESSLQSQGSGIFSFRSSPLTETVLFSEMESKNYITVRPDTSYVPLLERTSYGDALINAVNQSCLAFKGFLGSKGSYIVRYWYTWDSFVYDNNTISCR